MRKGPPANKFPLGNSESPGAKGGSSAVIDAHVVQVMERITESHEGPIALWNWCRGMGWTQSHTSTVMTRVRKQLSEVVRERAGDTRTRLLAYIERLLAEDCSEYIIASGGEGSGSVVMTDPKTGEYLRRMNHTAIQGYLKIIMRLTGIDTITVEHREAGRPCRDMSTADIIEEMAQLESEIAGRSEEAQEVTIHKGTSDE